MTTPKFTDEEYQDQLNALAYARAIAAEEAKMEEDPARKERIDAFVEDAGKVMGMVAKEYVDKTRNEQG